MNDRTNLGQKARNAAASVRTKAAAVGTAATVFAGSAMAGGGGFDSSEITAKITENTGIAVLIIGAMALAVWTLKSMGLLKRG